jgi:hypothetical protein
LVAFDSRARRAHARARLAHRLAGGEAFSGPKAPDIALGHTAFLTRSYDVGVAISAVRRGTLP